MSSSPTRPWSAGSAHAPFPLSRIHRLLRPLRTSLASLRHTIGAQEARKSSEVRLARERNGSASRIYEEPKGSRKRKWEDAEFGGKGGSSKLARSRSRGRPRLDHHGRTAADDAFGSEAAESSPLFKGLSSMTARVRTTYGRRLLRQSTSWGNGATAAVAARMLTREEMAVREKVERVVEAYTNVLDAVMELEAKPRRRVDRLAVMAARVVGKMLEEVVAEEVEREARELSSNQADGDTDEDDVMKDTSVAEDEETRAALVDEWYDAVPSHFRRHVLGQHALMLIVRTFPVDSLSPSSSQSSRPSQPYHLTQLYNSLNDIHLPFGSAVSSLACTLLPTLLSLSFSRNPPTLKSLHEAYSQFFGSRLEFLDQVRLRFDEGGWTEGWARPESQTLIRFAAPELAVPAFEACFAARGELIGSHVDDISAVEDPVERLHAVDDLTDVLAEFDFGAQAALSSFLDALVTSCLPPCDDATISCAKTELTSLSRVVFDAVTSRPRAGTLRLGTPSSSELIELGIALEAHRLAVGLPFLSSREHGVKAEEKASSPAKVAATYKPVRLQALLAMAITLPKEVVASAARRFLTTHSGTRLLALPPFAAPLTGFGELLARLLDRRYALRGLAKALVAVLLTDEPGKYFVEGAGEDGVENEEVRTWLESWWLKIGAMEADDAQVGGPVKRSRTASPIVKRKRTEPTSFADVELAEPVVTFDRERSMSSGEEEPEGPTSDSYRPDRDRASSSSSPAAADRVAGGTKAHSRRASAAFRIIMGQGNRPEPPSVGSSPNGAATRQRSEGTPEPEDMPSPPRPKKRRTPPFALAPAPTVDPSLSPSQAWAKQQDSAYGSKSPDRRSGAAREKRKVVPLRALEGPGFKPLAAVISSANESRKLAAKDEPPSPRRATDLPPEEKRPRKDQQKRKEAARRRQGPFLDVEGALAVGFKRSASEEELARRVALFTRRRPTPFESERPNWLDAPPLPTQPFGDPSDDELDLLAGDSIM